MNDKSLEEQIILGGADGTDETEFEWQRGPCKFEHVIAVDETCAICVYQARIEALETALREAEAQLEESKRENQDGEYVMVWADIDDVLTAQTIMLAALNPEDTDP